MNLLIKKKIKNTKISKPLLTTVIVNNVYSLTDGT